MLAGETSSQAAPVQASVGRFLTYGKETGRNDPTGSIDCHHGSHTWEIGSGERESGFISSACNPRRWQAHALKTIFLWSQ